MLNRVELMGRLTKDPESFNEGKCTQLHIAVQRDWNSKHTGKREADFLYITSFGVAAKFARQYLKKGDWCVIAGRVQMHQWNREETGDKAYRMEVLAEKIYGFGSKKDKTEEEEAAASHDASQQEDDDNPFS